jgi:hypothetical protein
MTGRKHWLGRAVIMEEVGSFFDVDGEPCNSKRIATYEHGPREWTWTN